MPITKKKPVKNLPKSTRPPLLLSYIMKSSVRAAHCPQITFGSVAST